MEPGAEKNMLVCLWRVPCLVTLNTSGAPEPFFYTFHFHSFQASESFKKATQHLGETDRFLNRRMVETNGESTPRILEVPLLPQNQLPFLLCGFFGFPLFSTKAKKIFFCWGPNSSLA